MKLIDADELKIDYSFTWDDITPTHEELYELIDRQPTIEERKKGEWIKMPYHVTECSECGFSLEDWIQGAFYNYCPNCGADMRGEADG